VSQNPIFDAVFQSWTMSILTTASRLGVFSRLEGTERTAAELARDTQCIPHLLEALLDACVGMGLLRRGERGYANSHLSSAHLVEGRPLYLGHILEVQSREMARWARMIDLIRTGRTQPVGGEIGEQDPVFTLAMNELGAHIEAETLASSLDLSRCRTLVDVGCGSGIFSIALCRHFPGLTAILLDRAPVLSTTARLVAEAGLTDRIHTRAGDMTTGDFGRELDAVLLSDSVYYDAPVSKRLFQAAHAALNPGGMVIIRGYYPDPGGCESPFGSIFRLNLLMFDPERTSPTAADVARHLADAGFRDVRRFALTERSTCFLATK